MLEGYRTIDRWAWNPVKDARSGGKTLRKPGKKKGGERGVREWYEKLWEGLDHVRDTLGRGVIVFLLSRNRVYLDILQFSLWNQHSRLRSVIIPTYNKVKIRLWVERKLLSKNPKSMSSRNCTLPKPIPMKWTRRAEYVWYRMVLGCSVGVGIISRMQNYC